MATDAQILDLIRRSLGYRLIDPRDKTKVEKALRGEPSLRPSSLIGQAAWELAKRIAPPPPPPPPPPPVRRFMAPQTYNKGSRAQDAQYCTAGLPTNAAGKPYEPSNPAITYNGGLCDGGRSGDPIDGLKPSDAMDGADPCAGYTNGTQSFPPWPDDSYRW